MPRAGNPKELECSVLFREVDGVRHQVWATEFIVVYRDQFGTPCFAFQNPNGLLSFLNDRTAAQLIRAATND